MRDPFLAERWREKAQEEAEAAPIDLHSAIYLDIKTDVQDPSLAPEVRKRLEREVASVEHAVLVYQRTIDKKSLMGLEEVKPKDFINADRSRTAAHDQLIGDLNALSDAFRRSRLDNSWRKSIGSERTQVTEWALTVGKLLTTKFTEES